MCVLTGDFLTVYRNGAASTEVHIQVDLIICKLKLILLWDECHMTQHDRSAKCQTCFDSKMDSINITNISSWIICLPLYQVMLVCSFAHSVSHNINSRLFWQISVTCTIMLDNLSCTHLLLIAFLLKLERWFIVLWTNKWTCNFLIVIVKNNIRNQFYLDVT